jgi:hypothetical protein
MTQTFRKPPSILPHWLETTTIHDTQKAEQQQQQGDSATNNSAINCCHHRSSFTSKDSI